MDNQENQIQEMPLTAEELSTEPVEQMDTAVNEEYGAGQIQVLEGLEAVRMRPGMYIGSTGPNGLHHLVYEIVDNSIDEALAGFCTHIEVEIEPGDVISVRDNGRGIPVDMNEKMGLPKGFDVIRSEDIPKMIKWADAEANPLYPVPEIWDKKDFCELIENITLK